jgi:hypothetical protein
MILKSCAFFFCLLVLAGCSPRQSSTDYDPTVDFSAYKSYAWAPAAEDHIPGLVDQQLTKHIDVILGHRGFELVEENPDLVVRYHAGRKEVFADGGTTYGGTSGYSYDEGRLQIDFIDPRKQEIVFMGKSETMLSTDQRAKPEQVKQAVLDALENFPPEAKQAS